MLMRFREVLNHVRQHLPNVAIGNTVEYLLAPPPRLQEPRGPQKTQVMGDQRLAEPEPGGDLSHAQRAIQATGDDREPVRLAEQTEHLGEAAGLIYSQHHEQPMNTCSYVLSFV
jgi:hypothetical protein